MEFRIQRHLPEKRFITLPSPWGPLTGPPPIRGPEAGSSQVSELPVRVGWAWARLLLGCWLDLVWLWEDFGLIWVDLAWLGFGWLGFAFTRMLAGLGLDFCTFACFYQE